VRCSLLFMSFALVGVSVQAQAPDRLASPSRYAEQRLAAATTQPDSDLGGPDYRIGADDELGVSVLQAPELNTTTRVSEGGSVSLPLIGTIRAAGLTVVEFERAVAAQLEAKYIKAPQVMVHITEIRSRPVSVIGAVARPGVQQLRSPTTLLSVLSLAGGLSDDAGDTVTVLRQGADKPEDIPLRPLMDSRDVRLNVTVNPGDVVSVRSADVVYVVGAINKPGIFAMKGHTRLTVLRALALGEGLAPTAAPKRAMVVRTSLSGERSEIPVDLAGLLKGRVPDVTLQAHDVLFVPTSGGKAVARGTLDAMVRILTWRPY
jgi:polysaccharide export outer membrane protein